MITSFAVPIFSQRDPRWARQRLGTVDGTSIGSHGCLITSIAMMDDAFDPNNPWTPARVDDEFTDKQGYANGNLVIWSRIQKLLPNSGYQGVDWCPNATKTTPAVPAPVEKLKGHIASGGLAILQVGFSGVSSRMHFLLAVGYEGNDIIFHDPWYGDRASFASKRYGSGVSAADILAVHYFRDAIPNEPPPPAIAPAPEKPVAKLPEVHPDEAAEPTVEPAPVSDSPGMGAGEEVIKPEWELTWEPLAETLPTKRDGAYAVDPTTGKKVTSTPIPAGTSVNIAGYYAWNGFRYARSVWAEANGKWNGVPAEFFQDPVGVAEGPVVTTPVPTPEPEPEAEPPVVVPKLSFRQRIGELIAKLVVHVFKLKGSNS